MAPRHAGWGSVGRATTVLQRDIVVKAAAPAVSIELREDRTGRWYRFRDRSGDLEQARWRINSNRATDVRVGSLADIRDVLAMSAMPQERTNSEAVRLFAKCH